MSRATPPVVIDARPRGPSGPLAGERVLGRPVVEHLLDLAESAGARGPVAIHARQDEHDGLRNLLAARPSSRYRLALGPPPEDAAVLRVDCVYDKARLKRAIRRGDRPEVAVLWRIDRPQVLEVVEDEALRRRDYQPLGRFWATRPALALARALAPTAVRPNQVTLAAGAAMLAAAGLVAFGRTMVTARIAPALAIAISLVLDTSDGHLARLQGTASAFGRWLDANLDELGDMALHAAVAWSCFARDGLVGWLLLGMAYAAAKYLFVFGTTSAAEGRGSTVPVPVVTRPGLVRRVAHSVGHADVRLHAWIVLAALGRLDVALATYTAYFFARAAGGAWRKAGGHA